MNDHRQSHVDHFAEGVKAGRHERTTRFLWTDADGEKHDITEEVLVAAGPQSDAESEARVLQREKDWPWRLASQLEEDLYQELEWGSYRVDGHRVQAADADAEHPDELIFERGDGKRFVVEIQVDVRPAD